MNINKLLLFFVVLTQLILSCSTPKRTDQARVAKAQNIILMIGDGMGLTQLSTSFYYKNSPSNFERFKHIGLIKTSSASHKITDSAAAATAFATGIKSYNGAIGVDVDTISKLTILELLAKKGWSTGLIATSSLTHATPASFYAHVKSRNLPEDIAAELLTSPVDFFAGGGLQYFNKRSDQLDYYTELMNHGYHIDTTELISKKLSIKNKYGFLLANDAMPKMSEGRGDYLVNATKLATHYLAQNDKGFFLMVEGSQIDWGGHQNDADYIISEVLDFDKLIGEVLDFAEKDGNTLVIVTADHETGGFSLSSKKKNVAFKGMISDYNELDPSFSTGGHSATLIPVFAYGPGADDFSGVYENTEVFHKALAFLKNGLVQ